MLLGITRSPGESFRALYKLSLYQNAGYLMFNSAINALLGFVFWILAARFYSSADVGIVSALIAAMGILSSLALLGLNIGLVRFLPDEADKRLMVNSCFTIVGTGSVMLAVVFIAGVPLWSPALSLLQSDIKLAVAFVVFTGVTALALIQGQDFIALRTAKYTFGQQAIWQCLKVALIAVMVAFGMPGLFFSWGLAGLAALLVGNLFFLRRALPGYTPLPRLRFGMISGMARFTLGNYGAETIGVTPVYFLPLIIINLLGAEPSAYFRIAWGIGGILFIIPTAIMMALFAEGSNEPEKLHANVLRAIKLILFILVPGILFILFLGDELLAMVGREYSENAFRLMTIFALSSIPVAINDLYIVITRVKLQVKPVLYTNSGLAFTILLASYILMSKVGLAGAGLGWLLGHGIVAIFTGILIIRWLRRQ